MNEFVNFESRHKINCHKMFAALQLFLTQQILKQKKETDQNHINVPKKCRKNLMRRTVQLTVYFFAHFGPVAFFRQMIALKITLKKPAFSTIYVGTNKNKNPSSPCPRAIY
jgi:hypothetical protein